MWQLLQYKEIMRMVITGKDMILQLTCTYSVLPTLIITFTVSNSTDFNRTSPVLHSIV